jgi:hypothetical protein
MNQETTIHTLYLPWLAKVDALIGKPARLDLARHTSFIGGVARGPQPARGGRRCQEPFDATLATLADALEAIGVNGCPPGWAADCRRSLASAIKFRWCRSDRAHIIAVTGLRWSKSLGLHRG